MDENIFDVIIIGGGSAGLSAALVLGRCRRKVLICDEGKPRNRFAQQMHGYLSRDGINPLEFLQLGLKDLEKYGIKKEHAIVKSIKKYEFKFEIITENGRSFFAKKILLATGKVDRVPDIPGFQEMYGKTIHHCPYCDGYEERDKIIAVYARGKAAFALSRSMKTWSGNVILCTDGNPRLKKDQIEKLEKHNIKIYSDKIRNVEGKDGKLERINFANGNFVECDTIFFSTGQKVKAHFAQDFGCNVNKKGLIITDKNQSTNVKGIFAAGDATLDMNFVIVAAAEGTKAGASINMELQEEEFKAIENGE